VLEVGKLPIAVEEYFSSWLIVAMAFFGVDTAYC
jgi:hypothetical protein